MTARNRNRNFADIDTQWVSNYSLGAPTIFPQASFTRYESMSDVTTPGWRTKIAQGEAVNNTLVYLSSSRRFSTWTSSHTAVNKTDSTKYYWNDNTGNTTARCLDLIVNPLVVNPLLPQDFSQVEDIAKQKCLANVDATPYELFEEIGEIFETINLLRSPLQAFSHASEVFRRQSFQAQKIRNALERAKALGAIWGTFRFAAIPLIRTVMTVLEAYHDRDVRRPKRRRASGRASASVTGTLFHRTWGDFNGLNHINWDEIGARACDGHAYIGYEVDNPAVDWQFKLGLRLKDVPTGIWELLPRSFMVDRFLNIKDMLSGIVNIYDPRVKFIYAGYVENNLSKYERSVTARDGNVYTYTITNPDVIVYEDFEKERRSWVPVIQDTYPVFLPENSVKDLTSILDLIAVLLQFIPDNPFPNKII